MVYEWYAECNSQSNPQQDAGWEVEMTCKIHRQVIDKHSVDLLISGRLSGDHVNTLRTLVEQEESSALTLDLSNVRLVDGEAVKLLATYESGGVKISNCPLYVREWIKRERDAI